MGIMEYSLVWVMQDLYHQPYVTPKPLSPMVCGAHDQVVGRQLRTLEFEVTRETKV